MLLNKYTRNRCVSTLAMQDDEMCEGVYGRIKV